MYAKNLINQIYNKNFSNMYSDKIKYFQTVSDIGEQ
jgi:hypothetical protein